MTAATGVPIVGQLVGEPVSVMFGDWETNPDTAQETVDAILAGAGIKTRPPIYYRRMTSSLAEAALALRRECVRLGIGLFIGDSLGMARGGEPESADMTLRVFAAARSLEVPVLFTDHVTNSEAQDARKPFGSAYTWNSSGMVWTMDKVQDDGANAINIALVNRKRNNGRLLPRMGYRLEFDNGPREETLAIRFRRTDLAEVPGLAEKLPLGQRILAELGAGPLDARSLAETFGAKENEVRARLSDLRKRERVVALPDGTFALRAIAS